MTSTTSHLRNLTPEQFLALRRPSRIVPREGAQELLPLSYSQERLWFLAQMDGGSQAYHLPVGLRLAGQVDAAGLEWAIGRIVARHEALRTRFVAVGGEAFQRIDADAAFQLRHEDFRGAADAQERLPHLLSSVVQERFDLEQGPLLRGCLVRVTEDEHVLVLVLHHIVSDGWSVGVLARELNTLYAAHCQGAGDTLAPLALQYGDYAVWQRRWLSSTALAKHAGYWRERLLDAPQLLRLPTDRKRPTQQDYSGASIQVALDADLTEKLKALSLRHGATLFMTVLAAWALVLSRLSDQQEVVIGTPTANRTRTELEGLIGFFVNTLALRIDLSDGPTIAQLLERVKGIALEAQDHQDLPFEQVVELVNPTRSLSHTPLFQVMFAWQNTQEDALALPGVQAQPLAVGSPAAKFDLTLDLTERAGRIVGVLNYATVLFDADTASRHARYLLATLTQFVADPQQRADGVDLLPEEERHKILHGWNATRRAPASAANVVQMFESRAAADPEHDALECEGERLSYRVLNEAANRLAHELMDRGVGADQRVALCLERSPEMIVAVLAVLKAGGCYVPLDPAYPQQRLSTMLSDAAPKLLLTQERLRERLPASDVPMLRLDADRGTWAGRPTGNPGATVYSENLIYAIYTSGSTGRPKGVAQTWGALGNLVGWQIHHAAPGSAPAERVLQFASLSFDVSFQEIFSTLCAGHTLVLLSEERRKELGELRAFIAEHDIRRAFLPNAVLQQIVDFSSTADAPGQCEIVTAGEALQVNDALHRCMRALGGSHLYNQYGPTEAHVVSQYALASADANRWPTAPPIGRPISNAQLYVLDAALHPVPVGVIGELYIGGAGLARGYLNRPDFTAERFLPNPFADAPGARMYRTGDTARYLPDGNIDFTGRTDGQVKIRGFRVELGEIEAALAAHPSVHETVVLAREDRAHDRRLVAYVVAGAGHARAELQTDALRAALLASLPDYMLPAHFVLLDGLPLTRNGKIDREALPAPDMAHGETGYAAPRTPAETSLVRIWAEILQRGEVGIHDNFFALGGHSMLAARLMSTIRVQLGCTLSLALIFKHPSVAELAGCIERGVPSTVELVVPLDAHRLQHVRKIDRVRAGRTRSDPTPKQVMLTGATGFVGAFLLRRMLDAWDGNAVCHCLVRAGDAGHAFERIRESMQQYGLWRDEDASRIVGLPGDLSAPGLGLDAAPQLARTLDLIVHNGAAVNHALPYEELLQPNVDATLWLLNLAATGKATQFAFISTLDTFCPRNGRARVDENTSNLEDRHLAQNGYSASKWQAEQLVDRARAQGLDARTFRLGRVAMDSRHGRGRMDDVVARYLHTCLMLGAYPDRPYAEKIIPVDAVADSVIALLGQEGPGRGNYHLIGEQEIDWRHVLGLAAEFGVALQPMAPEAWHAAALAASMRDSALPFSPYLHMASGPRENHRISERTTVAELQALGRTAALVETQVLKRYMARILVHLQRTTHWRGDFSFDVFTGNAQATESLAAMKEVE
ncbi:non-ribosomal peptide synthetase [Ramlibacter sp.]|uniref:non-ribosomal peptide synthetase n=1 Tax=Ramlibacter sp. TaxID=1917967 RepID=UPI00182F4184|nr:non-ribosomal peptide synthetase [Ramlibacter sp.]MBA2672560.1 amino acid adenylation domain-containing protein [Ramlibacter sp.]